jgi:hypothetical protein
MYMHDMSKQADLSSGQHLIKCLAVNQQEEAWSVFWPSTCTFKERPGALAAVQRCLDCPSCVTASCICEVARPPSGCISALPLLAPRALVCMTGCKYLERLVHQMHAPCKCALEQPCGTA